MCFRFEDRSDRMFIAQPVCSLKRNACSNTHPPFDRFSVSFDQLSTILRHKLSLQEFFPDIRLDSSHYSLCNGNWKRKWGWLRVTIDCKGLLEEFLVRGEEGISIRHLLKVVENETMESIFFFFYKEKRNIRESMERTVK